MDLLIFPKLSAQIIALYKKIGLYLMEKFLSPLWIISYTIGSILCVTALGYATSLSAAITLAGFLIIAGTIGIEYLTRKTVQEEIFTTIEDHKTIQNNLMLQVAKTEESIAELQNHINALKAKNLATKQTPINKTNATNFIPSQNNIANPSGFTPKKNTAELYSQMLNRKAAPPPIPSPAKTTSMSSIAEESIPQFNNNVLVPKLTDSVLKELVQNAVTHDRIEMFAQPIVKLPSRKLHALEVFARIRARAGVYVPAHQYREMAIEHDLLVEVDRILLQNVLDSLRVNRKRDVSVNYFINISTTTLKDFTFMSKLLEFLRAERDLANYLIFEFRHDEFNGLNDQVKALLKGLAKTGCQFSIDNVTTMNLDFNALSSLSIRFIKMDSNELMKIIEAEDGVDDLNRFQKRLEAQDMTLIADKVETERDVSELLDFEINFGEGFLFGKPNLEMAYRPRKSA